MAKYSEKKVKSLCDHIISCSGRVQACRAKDVNISYQTFLNWLEWYPEFAEAVDIAEQKSIRVGREIAILSIFRAMAKNWQAAAWWLERSFPDEFALRSNVSNYLEKNSVNVDNINIDDIRAEIGADNFEKLISLTIGEQND
jgi:hypothetical protein